MDFGLSGLLDKFESFFGSWATRFLVFMVGLATVVLAGSIIATHLIIPLIALLPKLGPQIAGLRNIVTIGWYALIAGGGVAAGYTLVSARQNARMAARLRQATAEANKLLDEIKATGEDTSTRLTEAGETLTLAQLAMEEALESGRRNGLLTMEKMIELRALGNRRTPPSDDPE